MDFRLRVRQLPLSGGGFATVDADDFERLAAAGPWIREARDKTFYARQGGGGKYMHQLLLVAPLVDHINRNGLDNRRKNLREADPTQSNWNQGLRTNNTSGVKGVSFHKSSGKWMAYGDGYGKRTYLGLFAELGAAEAAVVKHRAETRGAFA